jgi:hypothetical protein
VNDVCHGLAGCDLESYKKNITSIVDQTQKANIQVLIMTASQIHDLSDPMNQQLAAYNDFLHQLAAERKLPLADVNADETEAEKMFTPDFPYHSLTVDGVHMNPHGDQMMALSVLKAFGLNNAQLMHVQQHWLNQTNGGVAEGTVTLAASTRITLRDSDKLEQIALANKQDVSDFLTPIYLQIVIDQARANSTETSLTKLQTAARAVFAQKIVDLLKSPLPGAK